MDLPNCDSNALYTCTIATKRGLLPLARVVGLALPRVRSHRRSTRLNVLVHFDIFSGCHRREESFAYEVDSTAWKEPFPQRAGRNGEAGEITRINSNNDTRRRAWTALSLFWVSSVLCFGLRGADERSSAELC